MQNTTLFRRMAALLLTVMLAVSATLPGLAVYEMPIQTANEGESVYLFNADIDKPILDQNAGQSRYIASLTKMMTTLLLLENYQDQLDSISLTAPSYIYDLIWEQSTNASTADIRRGETQSLRNLL